MTGPLAAWADRGFERIYVKHSCLGANAAWCEPSAWYSLAACGTTWAVSLAAFGLVSWAAFEMFTQAGGRNVERAQDWGFLGGAALASVVIATAVLRALAAVSSLFGG